MKKYGLLLALFVLVGCGIETGSVRTSFTSSSGACSERVCNVQVTRQSPLTMTFQSNNLRNNSFTVGFCLNDGSGCTIAAQVLCDSTGNCRNEGVFHANDVRTIGPNTVQVSFGSGGTNGITIRVQ